MKTVFSALMASILFAESAAAADFAPNNLVVLRVGNGSTTIPGTSAPVSLLEFTPAGALVQTINLNSASAGNKLTHSYSSTMTQGFLSRSGDGTSLFLSGYNSATGVPNISTTASPATIARVGFNAVADLSTQVTSFSNSFNTGAASQDGTRYWATADNAISSTPQIVTNTVGTSGAGATVMPGSGTTAAYAPRVINGQLYYTDFNTALVRTNTPLPTGSSASTTIVSYNTGGSTNFPGEYVFLDRSTSIPGVDTLYFTGNNGLQKFSFNGANWTARGSIAGTYFGLDGRVSGNNALLFGTTQNGTVANNQFGTFTDTAAFDATISGSFTPLASAGANNMFYGVVFTPQAIPEPALLLLSSSLGFTWFRRRAER